MILIHLDIKPLSVNQAWQGRRFKTSKYDEFIKNNLLLMPTLNIEKSKKYKVHLIFGFSNKASDIDNPIKPVLDCITKKYGIDDRYIYRLVVDKRIVKKGSEYIQIHIEDLNN